MQMYLSEGGSSPDGFQMVTGWNLGTGNPSNTNEGFLQISDLGFASRDSLSAGWTDLTYETYQVNLVGSNAMRYLSASNQNQNTRLGVGPSDRSTNGNWLSYELNLEFTDLASSEVNPEIQRAEDEPLNVSGNLEILFENPNIVDTDGNPNANLGFYRVDIGINTISWSADNSVPEVINSTSTFEASPTPVPESASYPLLFAFLSFSCVLFHRRR